MFNLKAEALRESIRDTVIQLSQSRTDLRLRVTSHQILSQQNFLFLENQFMNQNIEESNHTIASEVSAQLFPISPAVDVKRCHTSATKDTETHRNYDLILRLKCFNNLSNTLRKN